MKIVHVERLIDAGGFSSTDTWREVESHILQAIGAVEWPPDAGSFTLYPESGKKRGEGNGVKPIKQACMLSLERQGWHIEQRMDLATLKRPGKVDAVYPIGHRWFAVEWETGNISSSHRALNKMSLGIIKGALLGGALIVPTRAMYQYLTDRVGNFEELEPYFPLYRHLHAEEGLLEIIAIEQDAVSWDVPRIVKGTDGRALL